VLNTQGLSLNQAPPIGVPLRFFLTAPLFAVAAGVLLVVSGPEILASRWSPAALAVTHLLTLGFLAQVMMGALMQLLPVLAGTPVPWVAPESGWIHGLLTCGAVLLAAGFLGLGRVWLLAGATASGAGLGVLLLVGLLAELVPMFYVTPAYPSALRKGLPLLVFLGLSAWALSGAGPALGVAVAGIMVMALVTLWMTQRRKRPIRDATLFYIWTGCVALVLSALAWTLSADATLLGVMLLGGVALAFPSGILNKVVPFLCWFHLQGARMAAGHFDAKALSMKDFIPERQARWQLGLYLVALVALLAGCFQPEPWSRIGGLGLMLAGSMLLANLSAAAIRYRRELEQVERIEVK
jgi:hypothetical protein